jgi:starch synthase
MKKLQQSKKEYPPGAILVQSSTYHSWPYPALMYKRGTWAAIDLIFTLDDIPMTFMGEQEGHAFREQTTNFYTTQVSTDAKLLDPTRQTVTKLRKLTRSDSIIQQREDIGFGFNTYETLHQQLINNSPSKLTKADI